MINMIGIAIGAPGVFTPGVILAPTTQATNITATNITDIAITGSVTRGNGSTIIVVVKQGSVVDSFPVDGTAYTAAAFGAGSQLGTGNFVVHIGSSPFTISGLTEDTVYHIRVFEFNGTGPTSLYNTSSATGNPTSITTFTTEFQDVIDYALL